MANHTPLSVILEYFSVKAHKFGAATKCHLNFKRTGHPKLNRTLGTGEEDMTSEFGVQKRSSFMSLSSTN